MSEVVCCSSQCAGLKPGPPASRQELYHCAAPDPKRAALIFNLSLNICSKTRRSYGHVTHGGDLSMISLDV